MKIILEYPLQTVIKLQFPFCLWTCGFLQENDWVIVRMKTLLAYSFAEFIHKNCIGNSSNLNEDFVRSIVGKPKSTGSRIKSQPLRMPNTGKNQGPSFPVSDSHHPRNSSCHMVSLSGMPFLSLPPTLMSLAALFLPDAARMSSVPWNLCLLPSARLLAPPSALQGAPHTHLHCCSHHRLLSPPYLWASHSLVQHLKMTCWLIELLNSWVNKWMGELAHEIKVSSTQASSTVSTQQQ